MRMAEEQVFWHLFDIADITSNYSGSYSKVSDNCRNFVAKERLCGRKNKNENARQLCVIRGNNLLAICFLCGAAKADVIYVDTTASGGNDGSTWANAFKSLQDALAAASVNDEIWVAAGTYRPDKGIGIIVGSRAATFQLVNNVAIYGGFPTGGGEWWSRNPLAYKSTLSGDLNNNDGPDFTNYSENSYHIVTGSATDATAILDGFTIKGGNANGTSPHEHGGGMYNSEGNPTIGYCTFRVNSAFSTGGGMYNGWSSPTVTNCMFVGNLAFNLVKESYGGGMYNVYRSNPTVTNCTFSNNKASYGAGLSNYSECIAIVKNCIFWQDESLLGPVSYEIFSHPGAGFYEEPGYIGYSWAIVSYSDIDNNGWYGPGPDAYGNIDADPNFIDPGYWDAKGTPEDITDDIWVNGDYHLSPGSPCIDSGSNLGIDIDKVDLDGDGITNEPVPLDMDGYARFTDDPNTPDSGVYFTPEFPIVDMGAYEYPGREHIKGDVNGDGKVDFRDIAVVAGNWLAGTE